MKFNYYFYNFSSILLVLIPLFLITGPLLSDLSITLIGLIFLLNCIKNKNFFYFQNLYFYIFIVFYLLICFSSFISEYNYYSLKPSITYIRFALFATASYVIISINQRCLLYLTKLFLSIIVVLLIDSSVQLLFGNNLLGWEVEGVNFRITSFFGDDEVLGSYIARFLPLIIALIIYCKDNLNFKNIKI
jgi:O-antigen ligase